MKSFKSFGLCSFLWLVAAWPITAQTNIVINEGDRAFIGKAIEYFVDTTHQMGIGDVQSAAFTPGQADILNFGNTPHHVWMRFGLTSQTESEVYLEVMAPLLSNLEVYEVHNGAAQQIFQGGFHQKFGERPIKVEDWLISLAMRRDTNTTYYLRSNSIYPLQVPVRVSSKDSFVEDNQIHNLFWGSYIGVMLFAFLYNFFIYLSVRERAYLYYLLYILGSVGFYLGLQGFSFQFVWPNVPIINPHIPILICFTNVVITLFTFRFLRITREQKVLFYWGWSVIVIFSLIAVLSLLGKYPESIGLAQAFSLFAAIYYIYAGFSSLRRKVPTAKYFLIAWLSFLVLVIVFILTINNVIPSTFFTTHCIFIGHMTEVLLLSFALGDRINWLKQENETKNAEIIKQLQVNEKLQTAVTRELEQKVTERTAQLSAQIKRSDELLLNILPEETAEEIKSTGSAKAKYFDTVTVMFTDFKDFTKTSERMSPQELVNEINYFYCEFDRILSEYKIEKIKTIGDSYMCAGGLPVPNQTNAEDIIHVAFKIQDFIEEENRKRIAAGKSIFEARIGINTGSVVAGIVGIKKFAYDIWGDTVNIASRMEASGEPGKVNISGSTYELVKNKFKCTHRGKIQAKNKGEIDMYFVEPMSSAQVSSVDMAHSPA